MNFTKGNLIYFQWLALIVQVMLLNQLLPKGVPNAMAGLSDQHLDHFSHPIFYYLDLIMAKLQNIKVALISQYYYDFNQCLKCNAIELISIIKFLFSMGSSPSQEIEEIQVFSYRPSKVWLTSQISLKIAFFDYGVCASPFEYETQDEKGNTTKELVQLQEIFKQQYENQLSIQFDPTYKWKIGKLDFYLKQGRYSPLYYDNIGVISNKFLMNRSQFQTRWQQAFDKAIVQFLTPEDLQKEDIIKQKNNLFQMDWIHFRTFVVYAYRDQKLSFDQIINNRVATRYLLFMAEKFQSKVINEKYKIEKLLRRLKKFELDIFFLQDINEKILAYIEKKTSNFRIVRCNLSKSAILISQKALRNIVGDSIRPLHHYNRKYLDPKEIYQIAPQSSRIEQQIHGISIENFQHRHFEDAKPKLKKKSSQMPQPVAQTKSPSKIEPLAKLGPDTLEQKPYQSQQKLQEQEIQAPKKHDQELKISAFIPPDIFKGLFWNQYTIVQFLSNIILITSSFNMEANPDEYKAMLDSLAQLKQTFPKHVIIAAINIDHNVEEIAGFNVYPNANINKNVKIPTMYNRKTLLQPKVHKAKRLIQETQDYLISTAPLNDTLVVDINYNQMGENPMLVPNESHPYDHYFVSASINCNVTRKIIKTSKERSS